MASNRIGRINEEIQRELAELIRSLKDPRVQTMISITRVDTTPDLRYSKIYVSVLEDADIDLTVAQIGRGIHARDGDHGLHPRVLKRADQLRKLPLDLLIDPTDSIGSHRPSLQKTRQVSAAGR